ncbi:unnamed protein product [Allacma fusca]|uniref:Fatty acid desaturase domain-containing protein n=1 Tax=Allacma fusca TaxID=39272 RepID=A0A8J2PP36_9HEXA|nr:unnamed protein product [Allacma fusca]
MLSTLIFAEATSTLCHIGVGAGAHRLFAHRSYKAKTPLRALLAILFAFAGQQSLWLWTAWHRVHHKLTDTDADPHNSTRGFFYSHIGWLLTYDHDKFMENYKKIDMSDMENDPIVMFHERYYDIFHLVYLMTLQLVLQRTSSFLS